MGLPKITGNTGNFGGKYRNLQDWPKTQEIQDVVGALMCKTFQRDEEYRVLWKFNIASKWASKICTD
jgi:hypothetical protein